MNFGSQSPLRLRSRNLRRSALATLNAARDSMAQIGFSPATRVFEAAGACLITGAWEGVELFLAPGEEVLAARDRQEVAEILQGMTPQRARAIGQAALARAACATPIISDAWLGHAG